MDDVPGMAKAFGAAAILLLKFRRGDILPCHTRVVREKRGLPWNKQVALHPLHGPGLEMKAVVAEPETDDCVATPPT